MHIELSLSLHFYLLSCRSREWLSASMLSMCSSVCLFVCVMPKYKKNAIFSKTEQFRAMVSIDAKVIRGLFKEPIIGP